MKYKGYTGKILKINLSKRSIENIPLSEELADDFIGGVGIAAKLLSDESQRGTRPDDEDNPLIFMTGPITGTIIPWTGRHCVATLSPQTGIWGEAYAGGTWGKELKKAGFDGIILTGKSDTPVYLKIMDQKVTIEDSAFLKGKDTYETESLLKKEFDENAKIAAIGIAGENNVKFASIIHEGPFARTAARCGVGTVMGAKNLKAIAVRGSGNIELADREKLIKSINDALPKLVKDPEHRLEKLRSVFSMFVDDGRPGINNWRDGLLPGFRESLLTETERHIREAQPYLCAGCRTGCVESNLCSGKRETVWEVIAPLGSQCGISDMEYVQKAYDLCNRHGIDTISAGGMISFAMECFEEGLLTEKDTDGIQLRFGNGDAMLSMLDKICNREGFGSVLAEGMQEAVRSIGSDAQQYAIEVKGLEVPAHDARSHNFFALTYATDTRGAHHISVLNPMVEGSDLMDDNAVRFDTKGTAEMVVRRQHYSTLMNALPMCMFSHIGFAQFFTPKDYIGITGNEVVEWFNLATGSEQDLNSMIKTGEKIYNLKHMTNLNLGLDASSDRLPDRLATSPRKNSPSADHLPQMKEMINDYYRIRGWEADGKIKPEKRKELKI